MATIYVDSCVSGSDRLAERNRIETRLIVDSEFPTVCYLSK